MSDDTTTAGGYPRGLRLSDAQDSTLRRWPMERIRPKSVALGVRSLFAEVDALRAENAALRARAEAAGERIRDALDCLPRALDGSQPFSLGQRAEVMLAIESLRKALAAAERAAPEGE